MTQVRDAIEAGVHRAGEALPSVRALAVEIRVNPNTVQRAYEELERDGIVQSKRGLGVFIVDRQSRVARGKSELKSQSMFQDGVVAGLDAGISPVRIRELFESAMTSGLDKARSRR